MVNPSYLVTLTYRIRIFQRDVLMGGTYHILFGKEGPHTFYFANLESHIRRARMIGVELVLIVKEPKVPKRNKLMPG